MGMHHVMLLETGLIEFRLFGAAMRMHPEVAERLCRETLAVLGYEEIEERGSRVMRRQLWGPWRETTDGLEAHVPTQPLTRAEPRSRAGAASERLPSAEH
jgi:hypothetical protein